MDDMTTIVVMIGLLLMIFVLMYILLTRRIDELQHDLEQLKVDSQSHTCGSRTVTCAVANLEMRMEDEPHHESNTDLQA